MRCLLASFLMLGVCFTGVSTCAQDGATTEPKYDDTFSGLIVEVSASKITVARSILGKPAEKRTFAIQSDTHIEGKLRVKQRVTVGFVTSPDGDVARLIVVRPQKAPDKK